MCCDLGGGWGKGVIHLGWLSFRTHVLFFYTVMTRLYILMPLYCIREFTSYLYIYLFFEPSLRFSLVGPQKFMPRSSLVCLNCRNFLCKDMSFKCIKGRHTTGTPIETYKNVRFCDTHVPLIKIASCRRGSENNKYIVLSVSI